MKALVIGASGGIGSALVGALETRGASVVGLSRRSVPAIDLADDASIAAAMDGLEGPFDLVVVASGILDAGPGTPEKSVRDLSGAALDRYFRVNATGPALVMARALALIPTDRRAVIAALGARVGSISDNRLGGWYGYRASKAALHQLVKTLSIEARRARPHAILAALHPGTVDTALSRRFQRGLPPGQLLDPDASAAALLAVIDGLRPDDSGAILDWRGERIAP